MQFIHPLYLHVNQYYNNKYASQGGIIVLKQLTAVLLHSGGYVKSIKYAEDGESFTYEDVMKDCDQLKPGTRLFSFGDISMNKMDDISEEFCNWFVNMSPDDEIITDEEIDGGIEFLSEHFGRCREIKPGDVIKSNGKPAKASPVINNIIPKSIGKTDKVKYKVWGTLADGSERKFRTINSNSEANAIKEAIYSLKYDTKKEYIFESVEII